MATVQRATTLLGCAPSKRAGSSDAAPHFHRPPRRRGGVRTRAGRVRLCLAGPAVRARIAAAEAPHGLPRRPADGRSQRTGGGAAARQELLRGDLGGDHPRPRRRRLSRDRARSDRVLQVEQAGTLSIQLPAACGEHARFAGVTRDRTRRHPRPFDRRHARHALRAYVPRRGRALGDGQPDRS